MADTMIKRAVLQIAADDGDTEAKLDRISAKADELKEKHPDLAVRIDTAAASAKLGVLRTELKDVARPIDIKVEPKMDDTKLAEASAKAGAESGSSFGGGFGSATGYLIAAAVVAALAAAPAVFAAGGAAAGIALGAALLIGTKKVQGPLYAQFHELASGLLSVIRTAALPLVQPLAAAFRQIGQFARALKPELTQVFAALGPMVAPLARGLEGLISGPLHGFLILMQSAQPAVRALSGVMSQLGTGIGGMLAQFAPAVKSSAQFLQGLGSVVAQDLPQLGRLATVFADVLGPPMMALATQVMPPLIDNVNRVFTAAEPLLPEFGQLAGVLVGATVNAMPLIDRLVTLAADVLPSLVGPLQTVINWVISLSNAAQTAFGWIGKVLNFLHIGGGGGSAVSFGGVTSLSDRGADPGVQVGNAMAAAVLPPGFSDWASGAFGTPAGGGPSGPSVAQQTAANNLGQKITAALGAGVRETIPQARASARTLMSDIHKELAAGAITAAQSASLVNQVQKALQSHIATVKADARKLGESLTVSLADSIASSNSASSMKTAVGKLLADVKTAYDDGILTLKQDRALTTWLDGEAIVLEGIAGKRAKVVSEISSARQLAASTASSVSGGYGLSNFASTGPNGEPMNVATIIRTLRGDVIQARQFGTNIKKLAREGLPKSYLMQLIQMGPVQGGPLAAELAAAALGDIRTISTYENQISEASGSIGKIAANIQFEGGKAASKGFLLELEKQKQALDKAGQRIAQAIVRTLQHDLGPHGAVQTQKIEIRLYGDKEFRAWLKKSIRVTGGNVQIVGA